MFNFAPNQPFYDPNQPFYDPNQPFYDPNQPFYDPNQPFYDPNQPFYDPYQPLYDPNQPFYDPNQYLYDPSGVMYTPGFIPGSEMFLNRPLPINQPVPMIQRKPQKIGGQPFITRIPSLHLPAILLLAFSWLMHAIATFIPYWSHYSGISDSRAGLWSARNFNYTTIQNFYFPEPLTYGNITDSIRFAGANTKGYLITVQFLMTFNFCVMLIVLILLIADFIFSKMLVNGSFLIRNYNTSDTAVKYGLLLYILYVFAVFEYASWITYIVSRHDTSWKMHVSFAFAVSVSAFLTFIFLMYVIEYIKIFYKNRLKWQYWYGPYIEWAFFVYLSALLITLIVICCPEWAYDKISSANIFGEIGPFKQCYLSVIYKKTPSPHICTLSHSSSNQAWVNTTQAFMLMAYIIGMIILLVIVVFRKSFLHTERGYYPTSVPQPMFTFIIAGSILFFCFIFTLIAISIFGGEVFKYSITVNWAYILAVFGMTLFLVAGILFILDGIHSQQQALGPKASRAKKFFFPAPLNNRMLAMQQPLLRSEPQMIPSQSSQMVPPPGLEMLGLTPWPKIPPPVQQMSPLIPRPMIRPSLPPMYPPLNYADTPAFPPQQMMRMPSNYGMEQYAAAPITEATLSNYFKQVINNPQLQPLPYNQGLMNYSSGYPLVLPNNGDDILNNTRITNMVRKQVVQQQRLNYNHERLLERYSRLRTPQISQYRAFGTSSLPGRNYDQYLKNMRRGGDNSIAAWSRARIGESDETYQGMDDESIEPLPRGVSSVMQHSRNDPIPLVRAEKFEPVNMYEHPIFGLTPAYIRPVYKKKKDSRKNNKESENEIESNNSDHEEETKTSIRTTINNDNNIDISTNAPLGYLSYKNWKTKKKHLIPVNPLLFKIYTQRLNGSIQSYGQSLYVPSAHQSRNRQLSSPEDISIPTPSDTDSVVVDVPHEVSSSSKHGYNKLHSQSASTTGSHRISKSFAKENHGDLSVKATSEPDPHTARPSKKNSNSLISSVPSTSALTTDALSTQNRLTTNNAGLSSPPSLSTLPVVTNTSSMSHKKPESVSTSNSVVPYQTISSIYNDPTAVVPKSDSTQTTSNQRKLVSFNSAPPIVPKVNVVSSSSDRKDNNVKKKET